MAIIDVFNSTVSDAVNKKDPFYETWIGATEFTPELIILDSEDIGCGAICNELEFARLITDYYVESLAIDSAEEIELQETINQYIDLPRRGIGESDSIYRARFKFIAVQNLVVRRTTRGAILAAIAYYVPEITSVQLIEKFDLYNMYFEIRFSGMTTIEDVIFLGNLDTGFIDQNFVGGPGLGAVITYLGNLITRIKAVGVDFDIIFVEQHDITKLSDAIIGTVQLYKSSEAVIKATLNFTKISDAEVV